MEFNLAQVFAAVAAANPDRDCIVFGDRRFSFAQTDERARRFARALHAWGLGAHRERPQLAPHESGQSHLGLYMANCNEFLEAMLGAYQARVAPFNVNYRYVADELVYLLGNAGADALMYHARFAPTLALALQQLPPMRLIHVDDQSGNDPLPGAVRYEDLLASSGVRRAAHVVPSPDDLYVLYTGGTTGMPKAVLWRQHDIYMNAMGGRTFGTSEAVSSLQEIVERSRPDGPGSMTAAPLMHGAAQWAAFINLCAGRPFVMAPTTTHFDPAEVWALASRERVVSLSIVGDAFGRPLVDALESGRVRPVRAAGAGHRRGCAQRAYQAALRRAAAAPDDPGHRRVVGIRGADGSDLRPHAAGVRPVRPEPGGGGGQRGHDPDPVARRRRDRLAGPAGPDPAGLPRRSRRRPRGRSRSSKGSGIRFRGTAHAGTPTARSSCWAGIR